MTRWVFLLALLALAMPGCRGASGSSATSGDEKVVPAVFGDVRWVAIAKPSDLSILEASARVRAASEAQGEVSLPVRVWVKALRAKLGDQVKKGTPLIDVVAPDVLDAVGIFQSAGERMSVHQKRRDELRSLQKEGLVTAAVVFEQEALVSELSASRTRALSLIASAQIPVASTAQVLQQGFVTLSAPVDGIVSEISVHLGETREPGGKPLLRVSGLGAARIEARVSAAWPKGGEVAFEAVDGRKIPLESVPIAEVVNAEDGTHMVWFATAEETRLPDQLQGVVRLRSPVGAWEVPTRAVERRTGQSRVRVKRGQSEEVVLVDVLSSSGSSALVHGGLREGDLIASEFRLTAEDSKP